MIFITENDVMKGGLPIYPVERIVTNTGELFNDGEHIIYVNGESKDSTIAFETKKRRILFFNGSEYA